MFIGPAVNVIDHFGLKKCVVAHNNDHISNNKLPMITIDNCEEYGLLISQLDNDKLTSYQTYDVIYFVAIPVKRTKREMSRLFQYLIVDIDVSLKSNYIKQLKGIIIIIIIISLALVRPTRHFLQNDLENVKKSKKLYHKALHEAVHLSEKYCQVSLHAHTHTQVTQHNCVVVVVVLLFSRDYYYFVLLLLLE